MNTLSSPGVVGFFRRGQETPEKEGSKTSEAIQGKLPKEEGEEYVSAYHLDTNVGDYLRENRKTLVYISEDGKKMIKERPNGEVLECPYDDETGEMGEFVQVIKPKRAGN